MDFRISRSTVDGLDDAGLFWALIEPVWHAGIEYDPELFASATPGQLALYVVTYCIREVCNGGLDQFFYNTGGMHAEDVRKALRLLGADVHAAAFEKALTVFPDASVPVDHAQRQDLLESIPQARRQEVFEPLEKEFFEEERFWPYFRKYVELHPNEFFVDASELSTPPERRGV